MVEETTGLWFRLSVAEYTTLADNVIHVGTARRGIKTISAVPFEVSRPVNDVNSMDDPSFYFRLVRN